MSDDAIVHRIERACAAGAPPGQALSAEEVRCWFRSELPPAGPRPHEGFSWLVHSTHPRGKTATYAAACFRGGPVDILFGWGRMWKLRRLDLPPDPFDALAEFEHHFPSASQVETTEEELRRWVGPTGYREWG